jgi:hypothetical protein
VHIPDSSVVVGATAMAAAYLPKSKDSACQC